MGWRHGILALTLLLATGSAALPVAAQATVEAVAEPGAVRAPYAARPAADCLVRARVQDPRPDPRPDPRRCAARAARGRTGSIVRPSDPADPGAGRIRIGWELYRAKRGPVIGTVLAIEGGPGYATTSSRDAYLDLFAPLLERRNLLLIDARGTGRSTPIRCRDLQADRGGYLRNIRRCGRQLGARSDLYGSAFAADDFAAVLDDLGIDRVDVYGDSYGTFLGQTFALRHPDRVRTLTLDAAYPVEDQNPWYPDLNRAMRDAFRAVCARDRGCTTRGGDPIARLGRVANRLRRQPLRGKAYDADGVRRRVRIDPGQLAYLMGVATYGGSVYQELDAAGLAWRRRRDPAPLLRIAAEQEYWYGNGSPRDYSAGAYVAVVCNDYPQHWDISSPVGTRRAQYDAAEARLRARSPRIFAPFRIGDWTDSQWTEYEACRPWPAPGRWVPPVDSPATYPDVPTLVLVGDLDSITSPEGSRIVADRFPRSTYVEVANVAHVTALYDYSRCASDLVVRFVRRRSAGDTSCAGEYQEVRTVERFPRYLRGVDPAGGPGSVRSRRAAAAVVATIGDVFPRWWAMYGDEGRGLRGGRFTTTGLAKVGFRLHDVRFVENLAVSGRMRWNRLTGRSVARVRFVGAARGRVVVRWDDHDRRARAVVRGRIGGRQVRVELPAP